jgi:hypothetical protein
MSHRRPIPRARRGLALCLIVGLASTAPASVQGASAATAGPCSQPPQSDWVFNGYNNCGVLNGAKPAVFRITKPAHIVSLADYHFNGGVRVKPGTIGLQAANGYVFGPYHTKPDTDGNWIATMSITVPAGTYTIIDSDPNTWSQNPASGGRGFVRVFGAFVASAPPVPAPVKGKPVPPSPSPTHPTCASTPPSTYLITPSHVAPGGVTSFLLSCQKAASLGFLGAFAPLKVLIYDEASFRNLKYVNGYLQPISPSFPVRPPVVAPYKVVGPNDIDATLPASMQPGSYIAVIVDSRGDVASMNILVIT